MLFLLNVAQAFVMILFHSYRLFWVKSHLLRRYLAKPFEWSRSITYSLFSRFKRFDTRNFTNTFSSWHFILVLIYVHICWSRKYAVVIIQMICGFFDVSRAQTHKILNKMELNEYAIGVGVFMSSIFCLCVVKLLEWFHINCDILHTTKHESNNYKAFAFP